jgi:hypothetical protein
MERFDVILHALMKLQRALLTFINTKYALGAY